MNRRGGDESVVGGVTKDATEQRDDAEHGAVLVAAGV
jgi:hypothetical protein